MTTLKDKYDSLKDEIIQFLDKLIPIPEYNDSKYVMLVLTDDIETHGILQNIAAIVRQDGGLFLYDDDDNHISIKDFHEMDIIIQIIEAIERGSYIIT